MRLPLAERLYRHDGPVFAYSFTWRATGATRNVGACHAVDLPFTFGTLDRCGWGDWVGEAEQAEALPTAVRQAWAAFARTGRPEAEQLPAWPTYNVIRAVMELGRTVRLADDPWATARTRCTPLE